MATLNDLLEQRATLRSKFQMRNAKNAAAQLPKSRH